MVQRQKSKRMPSSSGPSQRQLRVGEEVRHALSRILMRHELSDPVLSGPAVTIAEVRMSPDLRNATAFALPFGGKDKGEIAALNRARQYFRGQIAQEVKLRVSPEINFRLDPSFGEVERVESLLRSPHVVQDLEADAEGEFAGPGEKP